jgi:hypothetical protein
MSSAAGGRITAGVGANLIGQHSHDRNQEATVYVGNIDSQVRGTAIWSSAGAAGAAAGALCAGRGPRMLARIEPHATWCRR